MAEDNKGAAVAQEDSQVAAVGRSAALMSGLVVVSRLTGFLRTWAQSYAMAATMLASCYAVANNLPTQLYELVTGGMLVTAFLPVYMSVKKEKGIKGASEYTSNLISIVTLITGIVTVLSIVFAYQVVFTQSFSASADFDTNLSAWFFRFFAIEIVLYALSTIFSGVVNAERDYFWSNAAPIFNNFVTIASFIAYARLVSVNQQLALVILALGNPLGVLVQALLQVPSMYRHGIRLRWHIDLHDPALRDTLQIGIPSVIVMITSFVTVSVQTSASLAVSASGSAVSQYARLWYTLPYAILSVPITTALFTELSDFFSKGDMASFKRSISTGTSQILFFLVPFALFLVVFSLPLISIISIGRFSDDALSLAVQYLIGLAPSLPAYGVCMYLQKVSSSMRRMELYAFSNVVAAIIQVILCVWVAPKIGIWCVALTSFAFFLAIDIVMFVSLSHSIGGVGIGAILAGFMRSLALGLVGAAVAWAILHVTGLGSGGGVMRSVLACVAGGIPAVLVTYGLAIVLKVPESSVIRTLLARFVRR